MDPSKIWLDVYHTVHVYTTCPKKYLSQESSHAGKSFSIGHSCSPLFYIFQDAFPRFCLARKRLYFMVDTSHESPLYRISWTNPKKYPTKLHQNPIENLKIPSKPYQIPIFPMKISRKVENPMKKSHESHEIPQKIWKSHKIPPILQAKRPGTGTWTLPSLRFAELEALLRALRVARSAQLREVLMELVEPWKKRGKSMGKWENHGKSMGNPWENGKTLKKSIGKWRFTLW